MVKRAESFTHAGRGVKIFFATTHNSWMHIVALVVAVALGVYFHITQIEWIAIFIVSGLVFTAEAFNSAIELDIDLTSPQYHPFARDTKDIAAGAVLISAATAFIVGLAIFVPYFL